MSDANERVATYEYDGLFRRIEKTVSNQGIGVVFRSDGGGALLPVVEGIQAGNRHEHYFYSGWRLVETTDHAESGGFYSYVAAHVLGQFAYGTQYIDEPVRYDRNTDPSTDDDCLEAGGSQAYYYHQDANYRVVMLTGEDGSVVERYQYTAYGEPTVLGGTGVSPVNAELGNAKLVSTVGNPFQHQGLFRDTETRTYQNRFRQLHGRLGQFAQRDPRGYSDGLSLYEYLVSHPLALVDALGLKLRVGGSETARGRIEEMLRQLCPWARVDPKTGYVSIVPPSTQPQAPPKDGSPGGDDGQNECPGAPGSGSASAPAGPPSPPPGCNLLNDLINSAKLYVVNFGGTARGGVKTGPDRVNIDIRITKDNPITNADGAQRVPAPWEVLWHELVHARRNDRGRRDLDTKKDEQETIEEMNELYDWWNSGHDPKDRVPHRDPKKW